MNTNNSAATTVDIELPLVLQSQAGEPLEHLDEAGVWGDCPYVTTAFMALGDASQPELGDREPSLASVAAHPTRLRARWNGPVGGSGGGLSVASALRTGSIGLSELAACGR